MADQEAGREVREGIRGKGMNGGGGRAVSQADRICGEFRLVTMASIPWTSLECWRHQSDCSIHIITMFNPVCTGDVAYGEQNWRSQRNQSTMLQPLQQDHPTKQRHWQIFDT